MKTLNNFLDKASLFIVYLVGWFISGLFTFLLFYLFSESTANIGAVTSAKIGALTGLLFGLMWTLMISMHRKSNKFWDYSKEVTRLINDAKTVADTQSIYMNEFQSLVNLAMGRPHTTELTRLYAILQTKYQIFKNQEK
jgi:hypothetical protein